MLSQFWSFSRPLFCGSCGGPWPWGKIFQHQAESFTIQSSSPRTYELGRTSGSPTGSAPSPKGTGRSLPFQDTSFRGSRNVTEPQAALWPLELNMGMWASSQLEAQCLAQWGLKMFWSPRKYILRVLLKLNRRTWDGWLGCINCGEGSVSKVSPVHSMRTWVQIPQSRCNSQIWRYMSKITRARGLLLELIW